LDDGDTDFKYEQVPVDDEFSQQGVLHVLFIISLLRMIFVSFP